MVRFNTPRTPFHSLMETISRPPQVRAVVKKVDSSDDGRLPSFRRRRYSPTAELQHEIPEQEIAIDPEVAERIKAMGNQIFTSTTLESDFSEQETK